MSTIRREQIGTFNLENLSDVAINTPVVNYTIVWDGTNWVASPQSTISGGTAINFFLDDTNIIAKTAENLFEVNTLSKTPVTTTEVSDSVTLTNTTQIVEAYLYNSALNRTSFDAGIWILGTYASINSTSGTGTAEFITNIFDVKPYTTYTVTITGTGTSRRVNASGGDPFAGGDGNTDITLCCYIQTPKGLYQLNAVADYTVAYMTVPSDYVNESLVHFSVWKRKFSMTTGAITTTALTLYRPNFAQPAYGVASIDKIGAIYFAKSTYTISKTISFAHNGSSHYSYFNTPLSTLHDDITGVYNVSATELYGHLSYNAETIYGAKTFASSPIISFSGTLKGDADFLTITNTAYAADMDGTATRFLFKQHASDNVAYDNGVLSFECETDWTSTAATRNSAFRIKTANAGVLTNVALFSSDQGIYLYQGTTITTTGSYPLLVINNNNASKYYIGMELQRQSSAKWFIGMDDSTNDLIFRNANSYNQVVLYTDSSGSYLGIQSASNATQSALSLRSGTTDSWFVSSINTLSAPNNRLSFIYYTGSTYVEAAYFRKDVPACLILRGSGSDVSPPTLTNNFEYAVWANFDTDPPILKFTYRISGVTYTRTITTT